MDLMNHDASSQQNSWQPLKMSEIVSLLPQKGLQGILSEREKLHSGINSN